MKGVVFLRGIDAGGHTIVKMADRKRMFESLGLENVPTYIQSGNGIFECEAGVASLSKQKEIASDAGISFR